MLWVIIMIDGSLMLMENFPVVGQIHQQYKKFAATMPVS